MPRTRRRGTGGRFDKGGGRSEGRLSLHPENPTLESRMHANVPVRFGRGRLDSLGNKGLAAYLIAGEHGFGASVDQTERHADHEGSGGSGAAALQPDRLSDPAAPRRPLYSGEAARGGPDLMPPTSLSAVVRQVRKLAAPGDLPAAPDSDLLARFRASGDEAAFAALVQRHGPLVMGVCRRGLRHHQDAEDAFQATFLVLARKAASIHRRAALASWLYGVARRVAADARRAAIRRQARERRATNVVHAQPDLEAAWRELQAVLADEVERLPEKYQLPFVLCCLEGK